MAIAVDAVGTSNVQTLGCECIQDGVLPTSGVAMDQNPSVVLFYAQTRVAVLVCRTAAHAATPVPPGPRVPERFLLQCSWHGLIVDALARLDPLQDFSQVPTNGSRGDLQTAWELACPLQAPKRAAAQTDESKYLLFVDESGSTHDRTSRFSNHVSKSEIPITKRHSRCG